MAAKGELWVLAADEAVARLLRLPEPGSDLEDVETLTDAAAHADNADLRRDAHGRRGQSVTASAGPDESHREAALFARRVAAWLDERFQKGHFKTLRIVAAPRFLGLLRKELSPQVADAVTDDSPLDIVKLPVRELTQRLFPAPATHR
jgi:protein required for attachment to host cells